MSEWIESIASIGTLSSAIITAIIAFFLYRQTRQQKRQTEYLENQTKHLENQTNEMKKEIERLKELATPKVREILFHVYCISSSNIPCKFTYT